MTRILFIFLLSLVGHSFSLPLQADPQTDLRVEATAWKITSIHGVDYVSLNQLESFYHLEKESDERKVVVLNNQTTEITFTIDSQTSTLNRVKFFLSAPIKRQDGIIYISKLDLTTVIDPVLRPSAIPNAKPFNTVILDAGHGGGDQGSQKLEAPYTLSMARLIRTQLKKKGYNVILTRNKDITLPLKDRLEILHAQKNAIVISLHFNSGPETVHGLETYIVSAGGHAGQASVALATAVHSRVLMTMNHHPGKTDFTIVDRGVRHAGFSLLKKSPHPTILIELGFLSHHDEAAMITDKGYRSSLADSITQGIDVYRKSIRN